MRQTILGPLTVVAAVTIAIPLHGGKKTGLQNGDPPPGSAMQLSVRQAQSVLRGCIQQSVSFLGKSQGNISPPAVLFNRDQLSITLHLSCYGSCKSEDQQGVHDETLQVRFGDARDYVGTACYRKDWCFISYPSGSNKKPFEFESERSFWTVCSQYGDNKAESLAAAQRIADAFNRLVYASIRREPITSQQEFASFLKAAIAWRALDRKPPLSTAADRQRILAENAVREKDFRSAIDHLESALEIQPMWPAGWFNLAFIYAEQKDYLDAADRMRHYLMLVPNAPDARSAREHIIIWADKASH